MKKIKAFIAVVFCFAAVLTITSSCNKTYDDDEFELRYLDGMVIQNVSEKEGVPALEDTFTPHFNFQVINGKISKASFTNQDNGHIFLGKIINDIYYTTSISDNTFTDIEDVNGTYKLDVLSQRNEPILRGFRINMDEDKLLGDIDLSMFKYEKGEVKAIIKKVENATEYGYFAVPFDEKTGLLEDFSAGEMIATQQVYTNDDQQLFVFQVNSSAVDYKLKIYPVAIYISEQNQMPLVRFAKGKVLSYKATAFDGE